MYFDMCIHINFTKYIDNSEDIDEIMYVDDKDKDNIILLKQSYDIYYSIDELTIFNEKIAKVEILKRQKMKIVYYMI